MDEYKTEYKKHTIRVRVVYGKDPPYLTHVVVVTGPICNDTFKEPYSPAFELWIELTPPSGASCRGPRSF